ncbi:MAG: CBS domain-containing protein, partial [Methanobacteriota archaeon]
AYLITAGKTIYREQVPTKAQSGAHRNEYGKRVLEQIKVHEAMIANDLVITLKPDDPVQRAHTLINQTTHTGFPVLDNGRLVGILTVSDVRRCENIFALSSPVRDAMSCKLVMVSSMDSMENAMRLMLVNNIHHIPVAEPETPEQLEGFLTRTDVMKIYAHTCRIIEDGR